MIAVDVLWRAVNRAVAAPNQTAAFPTQEVSDTGSTRLYGVIVFNPGTSQFRNVPRNDLADPSTGGHRPDFRTPGLVLRQIDKWAFYNGFSAASADFEAADVGNPPSTVFGAFMYPAQTGLTFQDIPRSELPGSADVLDVPSHMVAVNQWARNHGYVGALPSWQAATYTTPPGEVWGTYLLTNSIVHYEEYSEDQLGLPHPSGQMECGMMSDGKGGWLGTPIPQPPPPQAKITKVEVDVPLPLVLENLFLTSPDGAQAQLQPSGSGQWATAAFNDSILTPGEWIAHGSYHNASALPSLMLKIDWSQ